ncbi:hypothetical protein LWC34_48020 [Kibdelosporangium philippinense]|uniref:Immunity protein Imm1 n=1 Tax=Kibdelosporangium philippinense TaxID=211113 RepID=A0ABS8ZQ70_9PSEU|nr:hypothetical protein [Kibdelosporangium philippinense]MCE7009767.1 hypothetical protein [Kibdelosporangium philippinense]MCE7010499.1 hypothetical protein [Kibdelosporangium philippinense]
MTADYYIADTENGDHIEDPSEDALFMLITDLAHPENTFLTVNPADMDAGWYASVSLLDDDTYEVERHHPDQQEPTRTTSADRNQIAKDLTIWLAGQFPSP